MATLRVTPSTRDLPPAISKSQWQAAVERAAANWSSPSVPCSSLRVEVAAAAELRLAALDGTNVIVFRQRSWCHNERCGPESTFPGFAAAMTTTYPKGATGLAVKEADIELNASRFHFTLGSEPEPGAAGAAELRNVSLHPVLLHELGHALGLPDACQGQRMSGALNGSECPLEARDSVMFAPALLEQLTARDHKLVCALFPNADASSDPKHWHDYLADPTTADAICDRVLHAAHRIALKGPSRRKPETPSSN